MCLAGAGCGVAVLQKLSLASRPPSVRFLVDLAEMSVVATVAATRASSPICRNPIHRTWRRRQGMHSPISEDDESHKQQAHSDANSERKVGSPRDVLRLPAIHQNSSYAARMRNVPPVPTFPVPTFPNRGNAVPHLGKITCAWPVPPLALKSCDLAPFWQGGSTTTTSE
jgi:hypothetical protein